MEIKIFLIFIFNMISNSKADYCTLNQLFNISTTGLIITYCSNYSSKCNETEFDFMNNITEGNFYEIDLTNIEIPYYSIQLRACDGCFGDDSLTFNFINEKCPSVDATYYTVYCELIRFRYNLSNSSQIETQSTIITHYELCDRLDYYNDLVRRNDYEDKASADLKAMNTTVENILNRLNADFYYADRIPIGFAYVALLIFLIMILWFVLNDLKRFLKFVKTSREKVESKRKIPSSLIKAEKNDYNLNIFRRVINANKSLFDNSYFQQKRIQA
jgi:hypothetical protein